MILKAVEHIAPLRGGSQAPMMRANSGAYSAVKFQGNPQHTRVLANEYLACRLAQLIGLSVPQPVILEVDAATIRKRREMVPTDRRLPHFQPDSVSRVAHSAATQYQGS